MVRLLVLLLAITLPGPIARAYAGEHVSMCHARSVRDLMARELHNRDYYAHIIPQLIEEVPYAGANTALCDVMDVTLVYDARVMIGAPLGLCQRHLFRVRAVPNGFVVDYLR